MKRKHIFILNPAAGQGEATGLYEKIRTAADKLGEDVQIYETKEILDAEVFTAELVKRLSPKERLRVYACGGDGTVNEVLNAIIGVENTELAIIPVGTGNDFVRNFGDEKLFLDLEKQMSAEAKKIDVIKYRSKRKDFTYSRYCINMFNIGFDCNVVEVTARLKKLPFVSGSMAYLMGVAAMLIKMKGADLKVQFDDGEIFDGRMLLIAIANGCFCGGGVKGVPRAVTDDGLMDISLIKKCSRNKFIRLFPKYVKGKHLEAKEARNLFIYKKSKKLKITANGASMTFSTDGEITKADEIEFEIVPKAVFLAVPKN